MSFIKYYTVGCWVKGNDDEYQIAKYSVQTENPVFGFILKFTLAPVVFFEACASGQAGRAHYQDCELLME
jgi:hypothetical protein